MIFRRAVSNIENLVQHSNHIPKNLKQPSKTSSNLNISRELSQIPHTVVVCGAPYLATWGHHQLTSSPLFLPSSAHIPIKIIQTQKYSLARIVSMDLEALQTEPAKIGFTFSFRDGTEAAASLRFVFQE